MNRIFKISIALVSLCLGSVAASACPSVQYTARGININPDMRDCAHYGRPAYRRPPQHGRRLIGGGREQYRNTATYRSEQTTRRTVAPSPRSHYEAPRGPVAQPTGQPYSGPQVAVVENGIKYTGKSCRRADGSEGREGFGVTGGVGCWRF